MRFKRVENDVANILKYSQAARCDDMALYAYYVADRLKERGAFNADSNLQRVFIDPRFRASNGIAPYSSVSRARRKLQEIHEELRAPKAYQEERKELERQYREHYAKGAQI